MGRICSVCYKQDPITSESADELTKELLEVLLIEVNFTKNPLLCSECKEKIHKSFEFKGKCVLTDDILFPYIKRANGTKVDLKRIYFEIIESKCNNVQKNLQICRLCLAEVYSNFYELSEDAIESYGIDRLFFKNFIPEVNLDFSESPVMCEECKNSLLRFFSFTTRAGKQPTDQAVEVDRVSYKPKRSAKKNAIVKIQSYRADPTDDAPNKKEKKKKIEPKFKCDRCTYASSVRRDVERHAASRHAKTSCPHCRWQAVGKFRLRMHVRTSHQENMCPRCGLFFTTASRLRCHLADAHATGDRVFRCAECGFACAQRSSLNRHKLRHADRAEMRACDKCSYATRFGYNLAKHKLVHSKPAKASSPPAPNVGTRTCKLCPFSTADKTVYSEHLYVHKYFSETGGGFFRCVKCDFAHTATRDLRAHALLHLKMRPGYKASNTIFDCDECDFVTIYVESWRRHRQVHSSERVKFRCGECSYVSDYRSNLAKHVLKHRRAGEKKEKVANGREFSRRCGVCSFSTKDRSTYARHLRVYGH